MIHGLLFVLKILIWIFLGILGLLLGILLFVLFCAVRYQADACRRYGELVFQVQIRFLLAGKFCFSYKDGTAEGSLRLLGIPLWRSGSASGQGAPDPGPGMSSPESGPSFGEKKEEESARRGNPSGKDAGSVQSVPSAAQPESGRAAEKNEEKEPPAGKTGFAERIRRKLFSFADKVRFAFQSFCDKIKQIEDRLLWLTEKWEEVRAVLEDPANQKSARLLAAQLKKLFRHVLPRRGEGDLTFGLEDPYWMGKLLSLAAVLYPFTHHVLTLHPVFDQNILEGEVHVRGRLRPGVMLFFMARLLLDSNIRRWIVRLTRNRI